MIFGMGYIGCDDVKKSLLEMNCTMAMRPGVSLEILSCPSSWPLSKKIDGDVAYRGHITVDFLTVPQPVAPDNRHATLLACKVSSVLGVVKSVDKTYLMMHNA